MCRTVVAGAAALTLGLLTPAFAPATQGNRVHTLARRSTTHARCAHRRGKASSSHGHASRACARGHTFKRSDGRARKLPPATRRSGAKGGGTYPPPSVSPGAPVTGPNRNLVSPTTPAEGALPSESGGSPWPIGGVVNDPIDPKYLTELPFGKSSFWIQPWRAYLDTWPASRLIDSLGINFNVSSADAEATAQLLQDSGFKLARREIGWGALSYSEPTKFVHETDIHTSLVAMHNHGLRPLILLNANSGAPGPAKQVNLETVSEAPAGAQTVTLTPASALAVVPGKTGFDELTFGGSPDILITSIVHDVATLSRPLPSALATGRHRGTTLLYAPFAPPKLANGEPNPVFQETLAGWLSYVTTVCHEAASIFGPEGYDLEIWNELTFGSQFLDASNYYSAPNEKGSATEHSLEPGVGSEPGVSAEPEAGLEAETTLRKKTVIHEVIQALLAETVAQVRKISPGVGITDGFASESPFPSGANAPLGLTALSKHPYVGMRTFPADYDISGIRPVNALGVQDIRPKEQAPFTPLFIPSYQSDFSEYTLTATSTETLIRDLSPITTDIYGFPHGREVGPVGGSPLQKWITEYNLGISKSTFAGLTPADKAHFHAKALLRQLVAMTNKGMARDYFFAAAPGSYSLIGEDFWSALEAHPGAYPGDALGGETMSGFGNMLAQFQGPGPEGAPRQLELLSIAQDGNHAQFTGDGTAAHPTLYDREVLAVLPFQSSPTRFVIPVYVMTRNLLTLYEPGAPATDVNRFDLPDETFRITLGNLPKTSNPPSVSAYDPLRNKATPAQLISREGSTAIFEFAATDYPRILTIAYGGK